jgi:hypothetical protein
MTAIGANQIDGLDRSSIAGGIEKTRDGPLHRHGDIDLGRWRRNKAVLFAGSQSCRRRQGKPNTESDPPKLRKASVASLHGTASRHVAF